MATSSARTPCLIEGCKRECNGGRIICGTHLTTKANKLRNIVCLVKIRYNIDITTATAKAAYEQVKGPSNYSLKPTDDEWDNICAQAHSMAPQ